MSDKHTRFAKRAIVATSIATGVFMFQHGAAEAALGDQTLSPGMRHQDVVELQDMLRQKGFFTYHTSTGFYGTITTEAVQSFQRAHQIQATGVVGPQTMAALLGASQQQAVTAPASTPTTPSQPVLKQGSRGQAVTDLQNSLRQAGVFPRSATGYFGPITEAAVKDFQLRNRLPVTGVADQQTVAALRNRTVEPSRSTPVTPSAPALTIGSRGQAVAEVQTLLKDANLFNYHTVTGYYGQVTADGVRKFQQQLGLPVTGQADARTVAALKDHVQKLKQTQAPSAPVTTPTPTTSNTQSFVMKLGSSGEAVRELQHQLKALGHYNHQITGQFGPITETAVKQFQQRHGLIADGVVTTTTMASITEQASKQLMPVITLPSETAKAFNVMNLIADASQLIGTPYVWGGTTSAGFDCSGFIQYVFQKNSVQLPRTVAQMWDVGRSVEGLKVGDLVFFETYMPGPSHAGIYIGNNQFIHSGSSLGVTVSNLQTSYWSTRYLGAKRYH